MFQSATHARRRTGIRRARALGVVFRPLAGGLVALFAAHGCAVAKSGSDRGMAKLDPSLDADGSTCPVLPASDGGTPTCWPGCALLSGTLGGAPWSESYPVGGGIVVGSGGAGAQGGNDLGTSARWETYSTFGSGGLLIAAWSGSGPPPPDGGAFAIAPLDLGILILPGESPRSGQIFCATQGGLSPGGAIVQLRGVNALGRCRNMPVGGQLSSCPAGACVPPDCTQADCTLTLSGDIDGVALAESLLFDPTEPVPGTWLLSGAGDMYALFLQAAAVEDGGRFVNGPLAPGSLPLTGIFATSTQSPWHGNVYCVGAGDVSWSVTDGGLEPTDFRVGSLSNLGACGAGTDSVDVTCL